MAMAHTSGKMARVSGGLWGEREREDRRTEAPVEFLVESSSLTRLGSLFHFSICFFFAFSFLYILSFNFV